LWFQGLGKDPLFSVFKRLGLREAHGQNFDIPISNGLGSMPC
jgi:hypothetical protein